MNSQSSGTRARAKLPPLINKASGGSADQIASLKPFAARNATFFDALLALILISSPVAGLRPLRAGRAGRIRTCRVPRLGMRIQAKRSPRNQKFADSPLEGGGFEPVWGF